MDIFLGNLFGSFAPHMDGSFVMWTILIIIFYNIFLMIKKEYLRAEKLAKISLIIGFLGTMYIISLAAEALSIIHIPIEETLKLALNGFASSIYPIILSTIGWLIIEIIELIRFKSYEIEREG
ncbi:MAG: hypothetical protein KAT05_01865 [Spirochaetes bacterium]|nr:hypothetical protein [Spirochaetota bacterium]